jgi:hypothetical protein
MIGKIFDKNIAGGAFMFKSWKRNSKIALIFVSVISICSLVSVIATGTTALIGNIGANVISGILSAVAAYYFKEKSTVTLPDFDIEEFFKNVSKAQKTVRIMDIWLYRILDGKNEKLFKQSLENACENSSIEIQILIVEPCSEAAKSRADQLSRAKTFRDASASDISRMMDSQANILKNDLNHTLNRSEHAQWRNKPRFELRYLDAAPPIAYYAVDNIGRWCFYPEDEVALDAEVVRFDIKREKVHSDLIYSIFKQNWDKGRIELSNL